MHGMTHMHGMTQPSPATLPSPLKSPLAASKEAKEDSHGETMESWGELDYFELKWILRAMAAHLDTNLHDLVGQVLSAYFNNESALQQAPQYVIDMSTMIPEEQERFVVICARVSALFCNIENYEGAIDVAELMLRTCYALDNFQDMGNPDVHPVYGSAELLTEVLSIYARCTYFEARDLADARTDMQQRRDGLESALSDATNKETVRRKSFSGQRLSIAQRREDEELHGAFLKKTEKINKDINEINTSMQDNTNQMRWIRRRASTAGLAAENLLKQVPKHAASHKTAATEQIRFCTDVLDADPDSKWGLIRTVIKNLTKNPLDAHALNQVNMAMPLNTNILTLFKETKMHNKINKNLSKILKNSRPATPSSPDTPNTPNTPARVAEAGAAAAGSPV